jgi:hypothetical protein
MSITFSKPNIKEVHALIQKELKDIPLEQLSIEALEGFKLSPIYLNSEKQVNIPFSLDYRIIFQMASPDLTAISASNQSLIKSLEQGQNGLILNFGHLDWTLDQLSELFKDVRLDFIHTEFLNLSNITENTITEFLKTYPQSLVWSQTALSAQVYCISDDQFTAESARLIQYLNGKKAFIHIEMSGDYFRDIAKIRAFKTLLFQHTKLEGFFPEYIIIGETSQKNKTVENKENNILKLTTEAMAAMIGGCEGLWIKPHDNTMDSEFSQRIARNIFHLMQEEAYLHIVNDVSSGSYFIEEYTEKMAREIYAILNS